jgi:hypothetical protein
MSFRRSMFVLAPALVLAACAVTPPPAPMLSIDAQTCQAKPDLRTATSLSYKSDEETVVTQSIAAQTPCFVPFPGAKSLYRVFSLPVADESYVVSVASTPLGTGVFAPHVTLLDATGAPLREIAREKFVFRGNDLTALFRSRAGERYLLVASDPGSVGQSFERVTESRNSNTMAAGRAFFTVNTGNDITNNYVYAHSGQITVTISAIDSTKS